MFFSLVGGGEIAFNIEGSILEGEFISGAILDGSIIFAAAFT